MIVLINKYKILFMFTDNHISFPDSLSYHCSNFL